MKRVHVTLDKSLLESADALAKVRDRVVAVTGMRDIDEKRLRRYGIISGTVEDEALLPELKKLDDVTAVELDEVRYAL